MTHVYVLRESRWSEEFVNGDLWPVAPTTPRPAGGRPISLLTSVTGVAVGPVPTSIAFVAGIASAPVDRLCAASPPDAHDLEVEQTSGTFVALTVHTVDATDFTLIAFDSGGAELDRVEYQDPWSREQHDWGR